MTFPAVPALPTIGYTTAEMLTQLQAAVTFINGLITNFNAGGVTETYLEAAALVLGDDAYSITNGKTTGLYQALEQLQTAAYMTTAVGPALDNLCAMVGVYRKQPTLAQGANVGTFTLITGTGPTNIPSGVVVSQPNADPTQQPTLYTTTEAAYIPSGQTQSTPVGLIASTAGSSGNATVGAINVVISGISGVTFVNSEPVSGGTDTEDDDSLRARGLNAIPSAQQCTVFALQQAALSYPGITSATVLDLIDPFTCQGPAIGYVLIYVDDGTGNVAGQTTSSSNFTIPQLGGTVTFPVVNTAAFVQGSELQITGANGQDVIIATLENISGGAYTIALQSVLEGAVGDVMVSPAAIINPNGVVLNQFNADLTSGKWRSAGCIAQASGSILLPVTVSLSIYVSSSIITSSASIVAAAQAAIVNGINSLQIQQPLTISDVIGMAMSVNGVADVVNTATNPVLINGANVDIGFDPTSGNVTLQPGQTIRVPSAASVVVTNLGQVGF